MTSPHLSKAGWRRLIANCRGLCSLVDTHIGTILNTLEDCGLSDHGIVVFTSDHADMMGPSTPPHQQGKSLCPWIKNPARRHEGPVFIEWSGMVRW